MPLEDLGGADHALVVDAELGRADEQPERPAKRRRVPRKTTYYIFTDRDGDPKRGKCILGCLADDNSGFLAYSTSSTWAVKRHVEARHPHFAEKFEKARNKTYSLVTLMEEIDAARQLSVAKLARSKRNADAFFRKLDSGLAKDVQANLKLSLWSVTNSVSRSAVNCPLFDSYTRDLGSMAPANRHDLSDKYLPELADLVREEIKGTLKPVRSVALLSDGWRDRARRNWIDIGIAWIATKEDGTWAVEVADGDIVHVPGSSTGDVLETLVKEAVEDLVPADCLLATSTNDGAGDEQKAANQLVQEGNNLHCCAHNVQLSIDDCLDGKRAQPPADCAPHREVIRKAHDLVVFINGHRATTQRFLELSELKRRTEAGAKAWELLILDNDTRWDTDLMLLERVVYFDTELLDLYQDAALGIPHDIVLSREEFDLAVGMVKVLEPFREFTKFVQYREKVTLAYVPGKLDELVGKIQPGAFDDQLRGRVVAIFPLLRDFQTRLIDSVKRRFASLFQGSSLALAALYCLPGNALFTFEHFELEEVEEDEGEEGEEEEGGREARCLAEVRVKLLDDFASLLPSGTPQAQLAAYRTIAAASLDLARAKLDQVPAAVDPLQWWPRQTDLASLHSLVKMLLSIPASSADNERSFSSASNTMGLRRTRLELESFRFEHRVRRFMTAGGADAQSQQGRVRRVERSRRLFERFAARIRGRQQAAPAPQGVV